jgi:phosphonate metabolism protein (transferase hexapeptide repeat family)
VNDDRGKGGELRFRDREPHIHPSARLKETRLGRAVEIAERVALHDCAVGDFTYFERGGEAIYTDIGKFCSIAANVRLNALEHPIERVTAHKISYRANEYFRFRELDTDFRDRRSGKRVRVGNDVWIGHGAVVMPGIAVGDGAVIGANAVVTKNVAPYAIVAGVPGRVLRHRFPEKTAERLRDLAWWDWPDEKLFEAVDDMRTLSAEHFVEKWSGKA